MVFDFKILAIINLIIQILLVIALFAANYLAKRRNLKKHCFVIRVAMIIQIIAIVILMLPSMFNYLRHGQLSSLLNIEILTHHTVGLAVVALWVYIHLVTAGIIKMRGRLVKAMRFAFALWLLALILGIHLYILIWI